MRVAAILLSVVRFYSYSPTHYHAGSLLTVQTVRPHIEPLSFWCLLEDIGREELNEHQAINHELPTRPAVTVLRRRNIVRQYYTLAFTAIAIAVALLTALLPEFFGGRWKVEV
jgi:hypothetical protein